MGNLFSFQGRFNRATYWKYTIALSAANLAVYFLYFLVAGNAPLIEYDWYTYQDRVNTSALVWLVVCVVITLVFTYAALAVSVRRWHDLNKSGVWVLISLIPIVGPLYAFVMQGFVAGTPGPNAYGPPAHSIGHSHQATHGATRAGLSDQTRNRLLAISLMLSMAGFTMLFATVLIYRPWYYGNNFGFDHILALIAIGVGIISSDRLFDMMSPNRVALVSSGVAALATLFLTLSFETGWFYSSDLLDTGRSAALVICALLVILSLNAVSAQLSEYDPRRVSFEVLIVAPAFGSLLLTGLMLDIFGIAGGLGLAFLLLVSCVVLHAILTSMREPKIGFIPVPDAEERALV